MKLIPNLEYCAFKNFSRRVPSNFHAQAMRAALTALALSIPAILGAQSATDPRLDRLKSDAARAIDAQAKLAQRMVDQVFSFGELGMQETETSKYLSGVLEQHGFTVKHGVAGIPTAWTAT